MKHLLTIAALFTLLLAGGCHSGDIGSILDTLGNKGLLDTETIAAGLQDALKVGTNNAVDRASKRGGYFNDALLKITVPPQFERAASTLRTVGLGSQVDAFERRMNDAAEDAAGQAAPVFIDAIKQMTFDDARKILSGNKTAATDFFRDKTFDRLKGLYQPTVTKHMSTLGVVQSYNELVGKYNTIPLSSKPAMTNIEDYVTTRALDGLFKGVAQQEQRIREDPAARTTALLRRVFASQ